MFVDFNYVFNFLLQLVDWITLFSKTCIRLCDWFILFPVFFKFCLWLKVILTNSVMCWLMWHFIASSIAYLLIICWHFFLIQLSYLSVCCYGNSVGWFDHSFCCYSCCHFSCSFVIWSNYIRFLSSNIRFQSSSALFLLPSVLVVLFSELCTE